MQSDPVCTCADGMVFGHIAVIAVFATLVVVPWAFGALTERRAMKRIAAAGSVAR